jgi:hypothetical protein
LPCLPFFSFSFSVFFFVFIFYHLACLPPTLPHPPHNCRHCQCGLRRVAPPRVAPPPVYCFPRQYCVFLEFLVFWIETVKDRC